MFPEDLRYTAEHEWLREPGQAAGSVRVGITDFAQDALGDIVFVQFPGGGREGHGRRRGRRVRVDQVGQRGLPPVGGEFVARNEALDATPELVNSDPYGEGWLFEVVADNSGGADLMDAATYRTTTGSHSRPLLRPLRERHLDDSPTTPEGHRDGREPLIGWAPRTLNLHRRFKVG